jgi:diguanylate cyclase (GGDEF)-like protein
MASQKSDHKKDGYLSHFDEYVLSAKVFESPRSLVFRAMRRADDQPVILKILQEEYLNDDEINRYKHEYQITKTIDSPHVIKPYGFKNRHNCPFIEFEDIGGESLKNLIKFHRFTLTELLNLAIKAVEGLASVHSAHIIHKDLSSSNIIYNIKTSELKIIDFAIASQMESEPAGTRGSQVLEGSLSYMSPEQTGRMNRRVDYRTDFYSLGVIFYELLTGQKPFHSDDPLKLIHYHIAKQPTPPSEHDAAIPRALSNIIMRLLAKNAEDRYQSAYGIKADLQFCLDELRRNGEIRPFTLGKVDVPHQFTIPEHLYGREKEVELLFQTFQSHLEGKKEAVFVSGYSGIGKSSLIKELYKPLTAKQGYFISGKFDEFDKNIPLSAIIQALREFTRQLLTEPADALLKWKKKLIGGLKDNLHLIVEVIPEVAMITGKTTGAPEFGAQTQHQFNFAFKKFVTLLSEGERPVVLFLDDMQWIDTASIKLLTQIIANKTLNLFFVGAYRSNQVTPGHYLLEMIAQLRKLHIKVADIPLSPMDLDDLTALISDTLHCTRAEVKSLSELVIDKTAGNPFFVEEFLKSLYSQHLIDFDSKTGKWEWSIQKIRSQQMTDNVIDLLSSKIKNLDQRLQDFLRHAACIGSRFEPTIVEKTLGWTEGTTTEILQKCVANGFIKLLEQGPSKAIYQFAHDRIFHASYNLNTPSDKRNIHYLVGKILLATYEDQKSSHQIFDIVVHLNYAADLITDEHEKAELCKLNLKAAKKAKASAAHKTAFNYLNHALALLGPNRWQKYYPLVITLYTHLCETAYLVGEKAYVTESFNSVIRHARSLMDMLPVFETRIHAEIAQNNMVAAAKIGTQVLGKLGIQIPKEPSLFKITFDIWKLKRKIFSARKENLVNLPSMTEEVAMAKIRFQFAVAQCFYFTNPKVVPLLICDAINSTLKNGNHKASPYFYSCFGMLLCGFTPHLAEGYQLGRLALELIAKKHQKEYRAATMVSFNVFIRHWREHLKTTLDPLAKAHRLGLEVGDPEFATHAGMAHCYHSYLSGVELEEVLLKCQKYHDSVQQLQHRGSTYILDLFHQATLNLLGLSDKPTSLKGEYYNEPEILKRHHSMGDTQGIFVNYFVKAQLNFLFESPVDAMAACRMCEKYSKSVFSTVFTPTYLFYESLIYLGSFHLIPPAAKAGILRKVRSNLRKLKYFAKFAPMNNLQKVHLISAELNRVTGSEIAAQEDYDKAIAAAEKHEYTQELALAYELTAKYYLRANRQFVAISYMKKARYYYNRWGARTKVKQIEERYPQLIYVKNTSRSVSQTISTMSSSSIDITTLKKALTAIAEETVHSKMLEKIISNAIEFAGAQKGFLILKKGNGEFHIEAEGSIDLKQPKILQSLSFQKSKNLSASIVNFVQRTQKNIVIGNASLPQSKLPGLHLDRYILKNKIKSILCIPIVVGMNKQEGGELIGVLYLENNRAANTFTEERIETLEIICLAAAGRLELSIKAATDGLTGLYNHQFFQTALDKEILNSKRQSRNLSLVMVDIDHFKTFNDKYGHQVGDAILKKVAATIQLVCRKSDIVARYGGEELCVILTETTPESALIVAERIRDYIENTKINHEGTNLQVTASIGISSLSKRIKDKEQLIDEADRAMYESKNRGRNRVTVAKHIAA